MLTQNIEVPTKNPRIFLSDNLVIDAWEKLEPYFEDLKNRDFNSVGDLEKWMLERSELEAVLEEDMAWRYIKMNIDTTDKSLEQDFMFFVQEVEPKIAPYANAFNQKLVENKFVDELVGEGYDIYLRGVKKNIKIYRQENIPLLTELQADAQKYGAVAAQMSIEYNGKELTLQQAAEYLKSTDRKVREEVYKKVAERRLLEVDLLNNLYSELIQKRTKVAKNAGFKNYRDYMFAAMGRFDYSAQDCFDFHDAIENEVVEINNSFDLERKQLLGYDALKPWDIDVDAEGKKPLKPFDNGASLLDRSITCFNKIHPYFGERLAIMKELGYLDLESKKGKAPGGFNYPLHEIGVPFIYMNSVGSQRDLVTMVHEGGHAIHSFLTRDLKLTSFKEFPSEVAELASMSMELISMDFWDEFYIDKDELRRAKKEQLQGVLKTLPWVASIDKFQHWVYENPTHTVVERDAKWNEIMDAFSSKHINWEGNEANRTNLWQKQLHLFEVPFYYIEYGMAQLGAIAVWRNYKQNPKQAIQQYMDALSLGYTKNISEIYKAAGIEFNFSQAYVKELVDFVKDELSKV